ncbi:MAG: PA14 domain-containing protein, partial [Phycisphaerales bacterium]|nr:PA14 domain-containing protein [Phycisphaerales bacterium]
MMSGLVLLLGGLLADPLPGAGAVMRVWQVESGLSALAPLVPGQAPNAWMRIDTIDLEGSRGDFLPFTDDFLALIDGSFLIEMPGEYAFRLSSDDGSQLWIGGSMVINHDGLHGAEAKTGVAT